MRGIPPRESKQFVKEEELRLSRNLPSLSASPTSLCHPAFGLSPGGRCEGSPASTEHSQVCPFQQPLPRVTHTPFIPTFLSLCSASCVHLSTRVSLDNCFSLSNYDRFYPSLTFKTNEGSNLFRIENRIYINSFGSGT